MNNQWVKLLAWNFARLKHHMLIVARQEIFPAICKVLKYRRCLPEQNTIYIELRAMNHQLNIGFKEAQDMIRLFFDAMAWTIRFSISLDVKKYWWRSDSNLYEYLCLVSPLLLLLHDLKDNSLLWIYNLDRNALKFPQLLLYRICGKLGSIGDLPVGETIFIFHWVFKTFVWFIILKNSGALQASYMSRIYGFEVEKFYGHFWCRYSIFNPFF